LFSPGVAFQRVIGGQFLQQRRDWRWFFCRPWDRNGENIAASAASSFAGKGWGDVKTFLAIGTKKSNWHGVYFSEVSFGVLSANQNMFAAPGAICNG